METRGNRGSWWAPVSLAKLKKAYETGTRGISWGPLLTPGPQAVPKFPSGQSAPAQHANSRQVVPWLGFEPTTLALPGRSANHL
ncbi:unnamed protein product, partial [Staurois parvus]